MNILFGGGFLGSKEALTYQGREILKQLAKHHKVNLIHKGIGGYWERFYNNFDDKDYRILIFNGHVKFLPELAEKYKKIISITVLECKLPKEWVNSLNIPEVKEIWTISEFCKNLIIESGVKKPVKVIYLGIDKRFHKKSVNLFPKDKSFKFLNVSAPHCIGKRDRKGLDILIKAFKLEFGDDPTITLILKINTIYADHFNENFDIRKYLYQFIPKGMKANNIAVLRDYISTEMLNNLYNSIDCGVFPSLAEGFGYPQAELMKLGIPVITSNYSATTEFSDVRLRIKIKGMSHLDYSEEPYFDSLFAEPDINHLRKLMRQVYTFYDEEKIEAEEHSKKMAKFSWDIIGKRMEECLNAMPKV